MSGEHTAEKDAALTPDERRTWLAIADRDGWELDSTDPLYARAVEAVAWELIEQTSDTADRGPSAETFREATLTAHRLLGSLRVTPSGSTQDGAR